jgi:hypothetical protein
MFFVPKYLNLLFTGESNQASKLAVVVPAKRVIEALNDAKKQGYYDYWHCVNILIIKTTSWSSWAIFSNLSFNSSSILALFVAQSLLLPPPPTKVDI